MSLATLAVTASVTAVALFLVPALSAHAETSSVPDRFDSVVVDAGHGGRDFGARGEAGLIEKDLVLDVARRLADSLRDRGLRVLQTRTDDTFVPLETRMALANDARADLFISIHANSARTAAPRGMETYFVSLEATDELSSEVAQRENDAFGQGSPASPQLDPLSAILGDMTVNEHVRESSGFATLAQEELARVDQVPSRGVKQAPFVVLLGVRMPASLVEIGFVNNVEDERLLRTERHRQRIADALTRAVARFGTDYDKVRGVDSRASVSMGRDEK